MKIHILIGLMMLYGGTLVCSKTYPKTIHVETIDGDEYELRQEGEDFYREEKKVIEWDMEKGPRMTCF